MRGGGGGLSSDRDKIFYANVVAFRSPRCSVRELCERNDITSSGSSTGLNYIANLLEKVHDKTGLELMQTSNSYLTLIEADRSQKTLKYICLTPHLCLQSVQKALPSSIILTSGTLSPLPTTATELGLPFTHTLSNSHVIAPSRVFLTCLPKGLRNKTLKNTYSNNGPEQFKELGLTISGLLNRSKLNGGCMVFFPSYKNMYETIKAWGGEDLTSKKSDYNVFNKGDLHQVGGGEGRRRPERHEEAEVQVRRLR